MDTRDSATNTSLPYFPGMRQDYFVNLLLHLEKRASSLRYKTISLTPSWQQLPPSMCGSGVIRRRRAGAGSGATPRGGASATGGRGNPIMIPTKTTSPSTSGPREPGTMSTSSQRRVSFASIKVKVSWQNNIYSHQNHSSVHIPSTLHIFIILYFNRNNCINHPSCTRAMWVVSIHLTLFIIIGHVMRHESYLDTSSHLTRSSRNLDTMVKTVAVQKTQFTFISIYIYYLETGVQSLTSQYLSR